VLVARDDGKQKKVAERHPGGIFGELALLYNAPRAATVVATSDATCWVVDRFTFRRIARNLGEQQLKSYIELLAGVELLSSLTSNERDKIAEAIEEIQLQPNTVVFKQGTRGDAMYFVADGTVKVSTSTDGVTDIELVRLKKGAAFGEAALLADKPRNATCTA
jgi:CRP-like cAMP-binding protein